MCCAWLNTLHSAAHVVDLFYSRGKHLTLLDLICEISVYCIVGSKSATTSSCSLYDNVKWHRCYLLNCHFPLQECAAVTSPKQLVVMGGRLDFLWSHKNTYHSILWLSRDIICDTATANVRWTPSPHAATIDKRHNLTENMLCTLFLYC